MASQQRQMLYFFPHLFLIVGFMLVKAASVLSHRAIGPMVMPADKASSCECESLVGLQDGRLYGSPHLWHGSRDAVLCTSIYPANYTEGHLLSLIK